MSWKVCFYQKNKGEQTEIKMNNDACIISIKAEILSNLGIPKIEKYY